MNTSVSQEELIRLFVAQCRSADMWVNMWEERKDVSTMRNAAMAIGKIDGLYNVMAYAISGNSEIPAVVTELMAKYKKVWESLESTDL